MLGLYILILIGSKYFIDPIMEHSHAVPTHAMHYAPLIRQGRVFQTGHDALHVDQSPPKEVSHFP